MSREERPFYLGAVTAPWWMMLAEPLKRLLKSQPFIHVFTLQLGCSGGEKLRGGEERNSYPTVTDVVIGTVLSRG